MTIHPVPVDGDGLRTDLLPRDRGSLLYVTPSHQFPTGAILPLTRRLDLLRWAEETDSYIVEDDYDSDFRYDGPPLTALAGLDGGRRVFYVGTFSKSVGAGLRIGFATVPRMFWDEARMLKARMSNGQAWLEQAALAAFIDEGHFDRHLLLPDAGERIVGAGEVIEGRRAAIGRELVGAQPILPHDYGVGRDRADLLDEPRQMPGHLRVGGAVVGLRWRDRKKGCGGSHPGRGEQTGRLRQGAMG